MIWQTNIQPEDFTNFLEEGAFLRKNGKFLLYRPKRILDSFCGQEKSGGALKGVSIAVCFWDFYGDKEKRLQVMELWAEIPSNLFKKWLINYLKEFRQFLLPLAFPRFWRVPIFEEFEKTFRVLQEVFQKEGIKKAVPVVFETSDGALSPEEKIQCLIRLCDSPEGIWPYGYWTSHEGVLGGTPEILFQRRGGDLSTMALAGTLPKATDFSRTHLLEDPKEMEEHRWVVMDLEMRLKDWGELSIRGPEILELPNLFHLQTHFKVRLNNRTSLSSSESQDFDMGDSQNTFLNEDISRVEWLHPTPALGVAPRSMGYHWMKTLPGGEGRGSFGAPLLFSDENESLALVMIRGIQWTSKEVRLGSGCGIVKSSELYREWEELYLKRQSVKKMLGL